MNFCIPPNAVSATGEDEKEWQKKKKGGFGGGGQLNRANTIVRCSKPEITRTIRKRLVPDHHTNQLVLFYYSVCTIFIDQGSLGLKQKENPLDA